MKKDEDSDGMWCLVMFDLPVKTRRQRREATEFRNMLLDTVSYTHLTLPTTSRV